jgi:hypothetical protein
LDVRAFAALAFAVLAFDVRGAKPSGRWDFIHWSWDGTGSPTTWRK